MVNELQKGAEISIRIGTAYTDFITQVPESDSV